MKMGEVISRLRQGIELPIKQQRLVARVLEGLRNPLEIEDEEQYTLCPICLQSGVDSPEVPEVGNPLYADPDEQYKAWAVWAQQNPDEAFIKFPGTPGGVSGYVGHRNLPFGARLPEHLRYSPGIPARPGHTEDCPLGILLKEEV